jgi:hypothetical protein
MLNEPQESQREPGELRVTRVNGPAVAGFLALALLAGCVHEGQMTSNATPPVTTVAVSPTAAPAPAQVSPPAAALSTPAPPAQPAQIEPVRPPVATVSPPAAPQAKPAKPTVVNAAVPSAPAAQRPMPTPTAAPVANTPAKAPAAPALDLTSLERRLRDTRAIGVFTKLSIKNQVDDLLNQFRALYKGKANTPLPTLRQQYEVLFLKVMTVVQDGDPPLATAIAQSREAIWGILSDPKKFAEI